MQTTAQLCHKYSLDISQFLYGWISEKNGFGAPTTYGDGFTFALLNKHDLLPDKIKQKLNINYSHEYSFLAGIDLTQVSAEATSSTSKHLIRILNQIKNGNDLGRAHLEMKKVIESRQVKSGFIREDEQSLSLQYHCLSAALLYEYFLMTNLEAAKKRFFAAVEFIRHFILPNGEAFYIGRKQQHSFGVGLLIYILSAAYELNLDSTLLGDIQLVLKNLTKYQLTDGSFPLVLNGIEKNIPTQTDLMNPEYCGWFHDNNYFDDLPMLGFYLKKSAELLDKVDENVEANFYPQTSFVENEFIKIVKTRYISILSLPGGEWTNGLAFPYLYHKGETLTPCLGGEEKKPTLFNEEMLSLPIVKKSRKAWRSYSKCFYFNNRLVMLSLFGIYIRHFIFREEEILIQTKAYSWTTSVDLYSFKSTIAKLDDKKLKDKKITVTFSNNFSEHEDGHSVSGKIKIYEVPMNTTIKIQIG